MAWRRSCRSENAGEEIDLRSWISLIKGPPNIIVDTGGPWDRAALLEALRREQMRPEGIHCVVCTHGHSDHAGNNNLFPDAVLIQSHDICRGNLYTVHDFAGGCPYFIADAVQVIPTPGHTKQDVSILVNTDEGIVALVGDLLECEEDLTDEALWRSTSEDPVAQVVSSEFGAYNSIEENRRSD